MKISDIHVYISKISDIFENIAIFSIPENKQKLEGAHESAYLRQALAFNAEKYRESRDLCHAPFWKNFWEVMSGLSLGTLVPNLKSVALIVFELLAFNAEKFRGSRDLATPPVG